MAAMNDDTISSGTISTMRISGKIDSKQWEELEKEVKKLKEANKMAQMGLYDVNAVDMKKAIAFDRFRVIAKDESQAKLKAAKLFGNEVDLGDDNVVVFVQLLGQWQSEKPKEVKIVKE